MKILLDENLPHDFRHFFAEHEAFTVSFLGWKGVQNGELLRRAAESGFAVLITMDVGVEFEHNPADLPIAVLIIRAKSNTLDDLRPLASAILTALQSTPLRSIVRVG